MAKTVHLPSAEGSGADGLQMPLYPYQSGSLHQYLSAASPPQLPAFAYIVVVAALWGRCMEHLRDARRPHARMTSALDFWARHQELEKFLLQMSAAVCSPSTVPLTQEPNTVFVAMMLHTITIYLHHSAVSYAMLTSPIPQANRESVFRCGSAAMAIAESARTITALDLFGQVRVERDSRRDEKVLTNRFDAIDEPFCGAMPLYRSSGAGAKDYGTDRRRAVSRFTP